jgi:uncharacterized Zn-binding protein involved in type VI secretion
MPSIARTGDKVLSPDGTGKNCNAPMQTACGPGNSKMVRANGILIVHRGLPVAPHPRSGCVPDTSTLSTFSSTVRINGQGVGRIGDKYGNNIVTQGSPSVFAG